jgi:zinc transporter 1/2/3
MLIFLMDFGAERWVDYKYGFAHAHGNVEDIVTAKTGDESDEHKHHGLSHNQIHSGDQDENLHNAIVQAQESRVQESRHQEPSKMEKSKVESSDSTDAESLQSELSIERSFRTQIAAFLILEFGVIFHSVIIGLNLGTAGDEFSTLYPVLVFHQSFEGLGIGARMSAIEFPKRLAWLPWALCSLYGLTTPIAIAIGLGLRTTYNSGSFTANVISGVLDSISAGILIYTGLVELLARDFLFNSDLSKDGRRLTFMVVCVFLGAMVMALLGKWA